MRSDSSWTTRSPAFTLASSPSSVTRFPRRYTWQESCCSSARSTVSSLPATSAATSLGSSMRTLTRAASCPRAQGLAYDGRHPVTVGPAVDGAHDLAHHATHVLLGLGTAVGDRLGDDRAKVSVGELGRQVAAD